VSRDVILSCYATVNSQTLHAITSGPKAPGFFQPVDGFKNPPLVITIPFSPLPGEQNVSPAYSRAAAELAKEGDGSVIRGALQKYASGVKVRALGLVTFSGGQAFAKEMFKNPKDVQALDTLIMLDGLHLTESYSKKGDGIVEEYGPFAEFGKQAVGGKKLMALLHTNIELPTAGVLSTTQSAGVVSATIQRDPYQRATDFSKTLSYGGPPPPSVSIKDNFGNHKTWDKFTSNVTYSGSYYEIDIGGNSAADHIFAATYGQRLVWKSLLEPRWNAGEVICDLPMSGDEPLRAGCRRNMTLLPDDMQPGGAGTWFKIMAAGAVGCAAGYFFRRSFNV
jgi:hypothetical protein